MKLLFIILIIFFNTLFAEQINTDGNKKFQEILSHSQIYLDNTKQVTIDDIQKKYIEFKQNNSPRLSFGYAPDYNLWIKINLKNTSSKKLIKILEYANPLSTHIEFYDSKDKLSGKDGLFQINPQRKTVNPYFELTLEPYESKIFYIKTSSDVTTMITQLYLWNTHDFYKQELKHQSVLMLFFGSMLILAFYNFFIYLFTKDISYFFYVCYMIGIILHHSIYVGIGPIYLYNQSLTASIIEFAAFLVAFPAISLGLFTKYFLQTSQYKKINISLNIFLFLIIFNSIMFYLILGSPYRNLLPSLFLLFLMIITIYSSIKGNKQALYIVFGWVVFASSGIFMYLSSMGILNIFNKFPYYIEIGLTLEAIIFSIALSNKIKNLRDERDSINNALIIQKETENDRLEKEVDEKTAKLRKALQEQTNLLQELNHRVKNNLQTIISLVQLQADEIDDKNILDIFTTIQNRVSAMSYLHELLYKKSDISYVNIYEYFDTLIEKLQESYEKEDITIHYNIDIQLDVESSIACGLILNELITNSFKYAFNECEEGNVTVEMYEKDDTYFFNVSDDGKGYDQENTKKSFGLVLIRTLVEDHLRGDILSTTRNGVSTKIQWKKA